MLTDMFILWKCYGNYYCICPRWSLGFSQRWIL